MQTSSGGDGEECRLAGAFYEADFEWEQAAEERKARWDALPISDHTLNRTSGDASDGKAVWERLYSERGREVYKPRRYIIKAFPCLEAALNETERRLVIADLGCGAGATLVPLLMFRNINIEVFASDLSRHALDQLTHIVMSRIKPELVHTLEWDLTKPFPSCPHIPLADFGLLIFCLSAIAPNDQVTALKHCTERLKPGGRLLIRDYGAYDMIQHRAERRVGEWTIEKQDGVLCTFYTLESMKLLLEAAGLAVVEAPRYCLVKNVNRKLGREMKRVFVRCVAERPLENPR